MKKILNRIIGKIHANENKDESSDLPILLAKIISNNGFFVESFVRSESLGNLILTITKGEQIIRFIRDRGVCWCEKGTKTNPNSWSDFGINSIGSYGYYSASDEDFFGMVRDVMKLVQ